MTRARTSRRGGQGAIEARRGEGAQTGAGGPCQPPDVTTARPPPACPFASSPVLDYIYSGCVARFSTHSEKMQDGVVAGDGAPRAVRPVSSPPPSQYPPHLTMSRSRTTVPPNSTLTLVCAHRRHRAHPATFKWTFRTCSSCARPQVSSTLGRTQPQLVQTPIALYCIILCGVAPFGIFESSTALACTKRPLPIWPLWQLTITQSRWPRR
jgi:hypothetical protein